MFKDVRAFFVQVPGVCYLMSIFFLLRRAGWRSPTVETPEGAPPPTPGSKKDK